MKFDDLYNKMQESYGSFDSSTSGRNVAVAFDNTRQEYDEDIDVEDKETFDELFSRKLEELNIGPWDAMGGPMRQISIELDDTPQEYV